jgi:hypothetical protein
MFTINGAASCVEVQGGADDPTVLLVGSSMLSWPSELCERLVAGRRRVIRYDVRDTGRSESYPPGKPGYSLADLVDDAVGVLDATATEHARPGRRGPARARRGAPEGDHEHPGAGLVRRARSRTLVSSDSAASGTGSRPTPSRPSRTSCSRTRRTDRATVETATREG